MHELCGTVEQINISRGGLPKRPVPEARVTALGLEGDACAHPLIHGGPQKAVLLLGAETVDELIADGFPLFYGALGENLTTRGLDRRQLRAGQRLRVGEVLLELTRIRTPCATLNIYGPAIRAAIYDDAVKAGDAASPHWARSGFYASVARTGIVRRHDIIALVDQAV
ncbi:MAG: MOSC domain-containing protein [Bryobacteraceae bacterium]